MLAGRTHDDSGHGFVDPSKELNAGLWSLFAGATFFLALRLWLKSRQRNGLWWDDYILLISWIVLAVNDSIITAQFATGYVTPKWNDRMHILINITSCGTLIGQAWTKTAFAVTLLKLTDSWKQWILWFCIVSMNAYMVVKVIFQWAKICGKSSYDVWYRLDFCIDSKFRDDFKEGGNVYNIIMDFVFAMFPWFITWGLNMRRVEKIGLCVTLSLGMVVAIVAAVRVSWKDEGNEKDEWYFWRNAMSNIWYSSEITGTIIVQCIPILRPLIRELHLSMTSKKLGSTTNGYDGLSSIKQTKYTRTHISVGPFDDSTGDPLKTNNSYTASCWAERGGSDDERSAGGGDGSWKSRNHFELREIPETPQEQDEEPLKKNVDVHG